jgi:uncharacterized protein (DUF362 family)
MKKNTTRSLRIGTLSRRDFIKKTSLGTLAFASAGELPAKILDPFNSASSNKSKIVLVHHSEVVDEAGRIQQPLLQKMVDKGMIAFSGEKTIADAWSKYFSAADIVGLKVNTLGMADLQGMDYAQHFPAVTDAIASGLKKAGIKEENMIIWDRSDEELSQAGFTINREATGIRVIGNKEKRRGSDAQFNPKSYPVGKSSSRVCSILADQCTALVNIPVPKTHGSAAFTGALKNHYGTIDNPSKLHPNNCTNPGIPEVNTIPIIRDKQKLIVYDAMMVAIDSGPRWRRRFTKSYGGILVGTDPVAIDTIALKILNKKREEEGMDPVTSRAHHIPLSAKLGLGTDSTDNIELVKITV